jgi:hypothetical protein
VADAYDRLVGRYGAELASELIDFAGVEPGMRALDVGCGPGARATAPAEWLGKVSVGVWLDWPGSPFERVCGRGVCQAVEEVVDHWRAAWAQSCSITDRKRPAGVSRRGRISGSAPRSVTLTASRRASPWRSGRTTSSIGVSGNGRFLDVWMAPIATGLPLLVLRERERG